MRFRVSVPASSANLGPGFDSLAVALGLYHTLEVEASDNSEPWMESDLDLHGGPDLVLVGLRAVARAAGRPLPGCRLRSTSAIPVARGLGSSAAALVAGLVAGNRLLGDPLAREDLLRLGADIEGHGDNVSAALYGGVTLVVPGGAGPVLRPVPVRGELGAVVFIPERTGLTHQARAVVPGAVPRADAVANAARCALLALALAEGDFALLGEAMVDRLHQPYRAALFPYLPAMIAAARAAGAYGASLSGAGPSVLALAAPSVVEPVGAAMAAVAREEGVPGRALALAIACGGAEVESLSADPLGSR